MKETTDSQDERDIRALIERQFRCLSWSADHEADWAGFAADFLPTAMLYPGRRPVRPTTAEAFADRMKALSRESLRELDEVRLGDRILVFGNVAVAFSVCELTENGSETSRNLEAMLLIKDDGEWKIAAQAWDTERDGKQIPAAFFDAE